MCVGKALTGGYLSMAATLCTPEVAARRQPTASRGALMHGPTFMGNPLAAAVSLASIRLLLSQPWQDTRRATSSAGLRRARAGTRARRGVADVRVLGAIGVVETVECRCRWPRCRRCAREHGVWLRPFGQLVYTMPPYVATDDDVAPITAAMVDTVATVDAPLRATALIGDGDVACRGGRAGRGRGRRRGSAW